jgi:hypothetical protein
LAPSTKRAIKNRARCAIKLRAPAHSAEPVRDGRIFIELINGPFLFDHKGSPAEYGAGLKLAIDRGWLWLHESDTYVKLTESGADLFAGRLLPKVACSQGVI